VVAIALTLGTSTVACSRDSSSTTAFCSKVGQADQLLRQSDATKLTEEAKAFGELRSVAPAEIADDVDILADVVDDLAATVPNAATPEAGREAVFTRRANDRERIEAAGRNVENYTLDNCGIALNPTSSGNPPGSTPAAATNEVPGTTT
jgi:hypothetical protein